MKKTVILIGISLALLTVNLYQLHQVQQLEIRSTTIVPYQGWTDSPLKAAIRANIKADNWGEVDKLLEQLGYEGLTDSAGLEVFGFEF